MKSALLAFLSFSTFALAVCVEGHVPIPKEFSQSLYVFTARVISSRVVPDAKDGYFLSGSSYVLRPVEVLKGQPAATLTVFNENSSGRFDMELGKTYLVFVYREHGRLRVDNCGNSGLLETSQQTLAAARGLSRRVD